MSLRNGHPFPKFVFAWQGMSLEALGKRREAMDAYRRALSIDPNFELAKTRMAKLQDAQVLNAVLGRSKARAPVVAPVIMTAQPGSQAAAVATEGEAIATPWTPPAPKTPSIVQTPPEPENASGFSLRPAFDDQPKTVPAVEVVRPEKIGTVTPPPEALPAVAARVVTPRASGPSAAAKTVPNGEGSSDVEFALQVGSFKTQALAEQGWVSLLSVAGDLLNGLSHVVEPTQLADQSTVYRLFAEALPDREAALGLCRTLRDKGAVCIVVRR